MILVQKPAKPLPDASLGVIVVEHRDRLARFRYVEQLLYMQGAAYDRRDLLSIVRIQRLRLDSLWT
jgi:hypothetical protein